MQYITAIRFTIIFLLFTSSILAQGPWIPQKGISYVQAVYSSISDYNTIFIGSEKQQLERYITDNTFSIYGEYGISDQFGMAVNIPISILNSGDLVDPAVLPTKPSGNLSGLGNISLSGKYLLVDKKVKLSLIGQLDFPTGTQDRNLGLTTAYDAFTFQPKLTVGSSGKQWFAYANAGYGLRSNDYNDIFSYSLEGGFTFLKQFTVILNWSSLNSLDNGNNAIDETIFSSNGLYSSVQEFDAFQLKFFGEKLIGRFGLFVATGSGMGQYVAATRSYSFGIFWK